MSVLKRIGWEPFGWLIYSLPYLFTSLFANISAGEKAMHVAFYVAFLVFYLGGQLVRSPRILWMVAGLDAIAVAGSIQNPGASCFFIYASALIARGFEPRTATRVLAAQVLVGAALSAAIDAKDPYTCGHSDRVARFSVRLAQQMGLPQEQLDVIYMGGLLHDIGKIGIDDNILRKPSRLTDEE